MINDKVLGIILGGGQGSDYIHLPKTDRNPLYLLQVNIDWLIFLFLIVSILILKECMY